MTEIHEQPTLRSLKGSLNDCELLAIIHSFPRHPAFDAGLGFFFLVKLCIVTKWKRAAGFTLWRTAIDREKLVKKWKREWTFALIEAHNPDWRDLWDEWFPSGGDES